MLRTSVGHVAGKFRVGGMQEASMWQAGRPVIGASGWDGRGRAGGGEEVGRVGRAPGSGSWRATPGSRSEHIVHHRFSTNLIDKGNVT